LFDWHYSGADKEPKDGCAGFIGQQAMAFSLGLNIFGFILLFISRKSIGRLKVGLKWGKFPMIRRRSVAPHSCDAMFCYNSDN
jgi:hypothetical protein